MHAVTSDFMRSTPVPQMDTTTRLAFGWLLDAAEHCPQRTETAGCCRNCQEQRRELAPRDHAVPHGWRLRLGADLERC
jgi:hypothetical protein